MKKAVILIHGFAENCEISFSQFLSTVKFRRCDIIQYNLLGHDPELESEFNYEKELERIDSTMENLKNTYDHISVIGFSLGGAIAGYIASKYKIDNLVMIAPSYKYLRSIDISKNFLKAAVNIAKSKSVSKGLEKISEEKFKNEDTIFLDLDSINLDEFPSLTNFVKMVDTLKKRIETIDCPTLIIHGENDELVPVSASLYILKKVTNGNSLLIVAPDIYHRVLKSSDSKRYSKLIKSFITRNKFKWKASKKDFN